MSITNLIRKIAVILKSDPFYGVLTDTQWNRLQEYCTSQMSEDWKNQITFFPVLYKKLLEIFPPVHADFMKAFNYLKYAPVTDGKLKRFLSSIELEKPLEKPMSLQDFKRYMRTKTIFNQQITELKKQASTPSTYQVKNILHELLNKYFSDYRLPEPIIKIVDNSNPAWLGRTSIQPGDETSTIEIQKSILNDPTTLRRVLAHELIHHIEFLTQSSGGHGKFFKDLANQINTHEKDAKVDETSNAGYVVEDAFYLYVLLIEYKPNQIGWQISKHITPEQKEYINSYPQKTKLIKSKDSSFLHAPHIGDSSIALPSDDMEEKIQRYWKEFKSVKFN